MKKTFISPFTHRAVYLDEESNAVVVELDEQGNEIDREEVLRYVNDEEVIFTYK